MNVDLKVTPDRFLPHRYAGASGDFNPIHIDAEFAKAVGLPNTILHGLYMMGLVARANTEEDSLRIQSIQRGKSLGDNRWMVAVGWAGDTRPHGDMLEALA